MLQLFGSIDPPPGVSNYVAASGGSAGAGLFLFLSNLFKLAAVIGGIYVILQFITAGYSYISANGDPKKTEVAFNKIWQSILGLIIISSAFVLAQVVYRLTGINIINPTIYGPS